MLVNQARRTPRQLAMALSPLPALRASIARSRSSAGLWHTALNQRVDSLAKMSAAAAPMKPQKNGAEVPCCSRRLNIVGGLQPTSCSSHSLWRGRRPPSLRTGTDRRQTSASPESHGLNMQLPQMNREHHR